MADDHRPLGWRWIFLPLLVLTATTAVAGVTVDLEGTGDNRWAALAQRMHRLRQGHGGEAVRILLLGDSHTAAIYFPARLADRLQREFGDAGAGLLPPGNPARQPAILASVRQTAGWSVSQFHYREAAVPVDRPLTGLGGLVGQGDAPFQMVSYEFPAAQAVKNFIVYGSNKGGKGVGFQLYEGDRQLIAADQRQGNGVQRSVYHPRGDGGRLTLVSRGDGGRFSLYGVSAFSRNPGVMLSRFGLNGATFSVLNDWQDEIVRLQVRDYAPHLLILAFGTNDVVNNKNFTVEGFRQSLEQSAEWADRFAPGAAVLLVMPPHVFQHGGAVDEKLRTARGIMGQVAAARGWRTWDWSRLTAARCNPLCRLANGEPMFSPDGIHLTRGGYEASGDALADALAAPAR